MNFSVAAFVFLTVLNQGAVANKIQRAPSNVDYENYQIQTGSFWVSMYKNYGVGRHRMVSIDSYEYIGPQRLELLTNYYNASALTNFKFQETFQAIEESTVSSTIKNSVKTMTKIAEKANLGSIEFGADAKVSSEYVIEETQTYTYSESTTFSISYEVQQDVVKGKHFALAMAGYTYRMHCQTWEYDDLWWGKKEVKGSRKSFLSYLTLNPFLTVSFDDGTIVL
jgi:hypothetical protein